MGNLSVYHHLFDGRPMDELACRMKRVNGDVKPMPVHRSDQRLRYDAFRKEAEQGRVDIGLYPKKQDYIFFSANYFVIDIDDHDNSMSEHAVADLSDSIKHDLAIMGYLPSEEIGSLSNNGRHLYYLLDRYELTCNIKAQISFVKKKYGVDYFPCNQYRTPGTEKQGNFFFYKGLRSNKVFQRTYLLNSLHKTEPNIVEEVWREWREKEKFVRLKGRVGVEKMKFTGNTIKGACDKWDKAMEVGYFKVGKVKYTVPVFTDEEIEESRVIETMSREDAVKLNGWIPDSWRKNRRPYRKKILSSTQKVSLGTKPASVQKNVWRDMTNFVSKHPDKRRLRLMKTITAYGKTEQEFVDEAKALEIILTRKDGKIRNFSREECARLYKTKKQYAESFALDAKTVKIVKKFIARKWARTGRGHSRPPKNLIELAINLVTAMNKANNVGFSFVYWSKNMRGFSSVDSYIKYFPFLLKVFRSKVLQKGEWNKSATKLSLFKTFARFIKLIKSIFPRPQEELILDTPKSLPSLLNLKASPT